MASFYYEPLDAAAQEIRVLDLLPGQGDIIECRLRHITLRSPGGANEAYEALSYCWGNGAASESIVVNGRTLLVTPNLHAALRHLRGRDVDGAPPRTLWVDAVCINQGDEADKTAQLPRMGDIYAGCRRAVVWLGEADAYTRPAFDGLALLAAEELAVGFRDVEDFVWRRWRSVRLGRPHEDAATQSPLGRAGRLREAVHFSWTQHRLFARPWFARLWVVQELALCPGAVVHCGPFALDWEAIARVHARWPAALANNDHLGALLRIRALPPPASPRANVFLDLMLQVWHKDCSLPQDKIYGLVGLARARGLEAPVTVDYSKDASEVFTEFTTRYLQQTRNLQTLAICRGCKTASGPSWAIDPYYSKAEDPLPHNLISWHPKYSGALRAGGVSGEPLECRTPVLDGHLLRLEGYPLDTVVAVSIANRPPPLGSNLAEVLEDFRRTVGDYRFYLDAKRLVPSAKVYRPTGQTSMEAFWCTIMGACPPGPGDPEGGNQKHSNSALQKLLTDFETADRYLAPYAGLLAIGGWVAWLAFVFIYAARIAYILLGKSSGLLYAVHNATGVTGQRRFFVTADGHMGLGPQTMRVGDEVLILRGHGAPVVARRTQQWRVVGDCHLHGAMEGEAFEMVKCRPLWFA